MTKVAKLSSLPAPSEWKCMSCGTVFTFWNAAGRTTPEECPNCECKFTDVFTDTLDEVQK